MALTVAFVLAVLSMLHLYGGVEEIEGPSAVIPEVNGRPAFVPEQRDWFLMAAVLALACILVTTRGGLLRSPLPESFTQIGTIGVGALLVLRAIGDFHTLGFFKRVRGTLFAEWDTRLFSPLSLLLGLATLWLAFMDVAV